jgi:sugar phosphate permease
VYQLFGGRSVVDNALLLGTVGFLLFGPDSLLSGTMSQEIGGYGATARIAGIINGMGSVGAMFSPLLTAWVSERFGWGSLFFGFVGVTMVAALLLSVAQALLLRPARSLA